MLISLIEFPFFRKLLFPIELNSISFSFKSKISKAFREEFGIIGYNKKLIFLTTLM